MSIDLKMFGRLLVLGAVTAVVGGFLSGMLTFLPSTKLLIQGLSWNSAVSYGVGVAVGDWVTKMLKL